MSRWLGGGGGNPPPPGWGGGGGGEQSVCFTMDMRGPHRVRHGHGNRALVRVAAVQREADYGLHPIAPAAVIRAHYDFDAGRLVDDLRVPQWLSYSQLLGL